MPAYNMGGLSVVPSNPSAGSVVIMSPFSGPKGSPFDATKFNPTTQVEEADPDNMSTGALSTGIGFGPNNVIENVNLFGQILPGSPGGGFDDNYTPGISMPASTEAVPVLATTAILTAIGGGKSAIVNGTGPGGNGTPVGTFSSQPAPYVAQPLLAFGNGAARDAGAGPAFTGFGMKTVTAIADVANGAVVETGFVNRSGVTIRPGHSVFGSSTTASPAVT